MLSQNPHTLLAPITEHLRRGVPEKSLFLLFARRRRRRARREKKLGHSPKPQVEGCRRYSSPGRLSLNNPAKLTPMGVPPRQFSYLGGWMGKIHNADPKQRKKHVTIYYLPD